MVWRGALTGQKGNGDKWHGGETGNGAGFDPGPDMAMSVLRSLTGGVVLCNVHDRAINMGQKVIRDLVTLFGVEKAQSVNCAEKLRRVCGEEVFHCPIPSMSLGRETIPAPDVLSVKDRTWQDRKQPSHACPKAPPSLPPGFVLPSPYGQGMLGRGSHTLPYHRR